MASGSVYALILTLFFHVLPLWSYTYGLIKLKTSEALETELFFTSTIIRFEMCPNSILNTTCNQEFAAVKAKFGPTSDGEIVGSFTSVYPKDACGFALSTETQDSLTSFPVIALISKGNCSFDTKVANAERAGFHAAIIYASKEDTTLIEMESSIPAVPVSIPAFFVSHHAGTILTYVSVLSNSTRSALLSISTQVPSASKGRTNLHIKKIKDGLSIREGEKVVNGDTEAESNFGERYFHICIYIWACVVVSSLIALSIKWGCCSRSLTRWEVKKIPLKRFRRADGFEYQDKCPICHEEFHEGYLVRQLPCHHCYHSYCVDRWLVKMSNRCPLCKQRVSVSLLCSWTKQPDREHLSQSAAEAEAEASASELPPLPPIQSLTPSSLYGETIMSGPSKFIIMRPGRPTRIIEVTKKEDGRRKTSRSEKTKAKSSAPKGARALSESSLTDEYPQRQLPVSSNDVALQLNETHALSQSPRQEHIYLECLDRETDSSCDKSVGVNPASNDQTVMERETSKADASVENFLIDRQCECDEIHKLWLNKPEDVVSPLLNSGSGECPIRCDKCANETVIASGQAGQLLTDHRHQVQLSCAAMDEDTCSTL